MKRYKLEYVWLDGTLPEPQLRSKVKVISIPKNTIPQLEDLPDWGFDGSSTGQAKGNFSDCILKPVRIVPNPLHSDSYLVLAEVFESSEKPHPTNYRSLCPNAVDVWFGFEQEYIIMKNGRPLGFPPTGFPKPQGDYYCGVGYDNVCGRELVDKHMDYCFEIGLDITGTNAEVMLGQWEFQIFAKDAKQAADDCWLARYLLIRMAEEYGWNISFHPKPVIGDWNGSGMHTNFSTKKMREVGGEELFKSICEEFGKYHKNHIAVYGSMNELRLTGAHETQSIDKFSYGVSDRGASIRIPASTDETGKGYLEDRRPASNADPYKIVARILKTLKGIEA